MGQRPVVGIDGYPGGWLAARLAGRTWTWQVASIDDIDALLDPQAVTAIDMPIGLADSGWRECDELAAAQLVGRRSTIFRIPPRPVLQAHAAGASKAETQQLSRDLTGAGTSVFALALTRRILALDGAASSATDVVEAHPELSFSELAGHVLDKKTSARGVGQRVVALRPWLGDVDSVLAEAPVDVPVEDALDALACAWTAQRWSRGEARTLPSQAVTRPFIAI